MAKVPIYPGSSSFFPGDTPFGFYDNDIDFQQDADKITSFVARRLGYPIMDVELQDINFYTAFEEAVTTYGNELYAYQIRENYLSIEGSTTSSNLNHEIITPNFANIVRYSEQYGEEAGIGGTTTWYTGSIDLKDGKQDYDLELWANASASLTTGDSIEIKRIFYESQPASSRYLSPFNDFGLDGGSAAAGFMGYGNDVGGYLMMPISFDLQRIQAIGFNDMIRRSQHSFELVNNKLRIFPIPNRNHKLWFQYIKLSERNNPISYSPRGSGNVTNVSNVPYNNPTYLQINSIGRSWIYEYTLAICKEMLGYIRGKYSTVPIPGDSVTLNQSDLVSAATTEKNALIERLRGYFDETSRDKLLERRVAETDLRIKELNAVPYPIYIG
jgi:hypothetical protein